MGMREYENGTVIFYEDEYDIPKPSGGTGHTTTIDESE